MDGSGCALGVGGLMSFLAGKSRIGNVRDFATFHMPGFCLPITDFVGHLKP